jgi:hypothetical protein
MKSAIVAAFIAVIALSVAFVQWRKAGVLFAENAALRAQIEALNQTPETPADDSERLKTLTTAVNDAKELARLRNEVRQLRSITNEAQKSQSAAVQSRPGSPSGTAAEPAPDTEQAEPVKIPNQFTREQWVFAGYKTPEDALVSAIWAMREGVPKTYFDGLSPDEQARMTKEWENKSETDVAAKHQSDVANIKSIHIIERQEVSDGQVNMKVYVHGGVPDANGEAGSSVRNVAMKRVGDQWRFGGFIREPTN